MAPRRPSRAPSIAPGAARHKAELQPKKPSYKVMFEEVTERKKKLLTLLTHHKKAPPGYTFIAHGDPQLTNRCKKFAREDGAEVLIVSASNQRNGALSTEVHRIGYHFPSSVVDKACNSLGVRISSTGQTIHDQRISLPVPQIPQPQMAKGSRKAKNRRQIPTESTATPLPVVSQADIDTEAKEAIRDLFPNIPHETLEEIVRHSFQKATNKVGTAADLPLTRRATLAVVAHIRHIFTDYDRLLRDYEWREARRIVEHPTLDKLVEWRADKDDLTDVISDILREVIVIEDDEEEDDTQETVEKAMKSQPPGQNRDSSVEIISSQVRAEDLQMEQINYRNARGPDAEQSATLTDLEPYVYREQPRRSRRLLDRTEAHRRQAWQDARSRHHHGPGEKANRLIGRNHQGSTASLKPHMQTHPLRFNTKNALANGIIDLTENSSPHIADGRPALSFSAFNKAEGTQSLQGRLSKLIPVDYRGHRGGVHPQTPLAPGKSYESQYPSTPRSGRAEQIMLSVEDSPMNDARRDPVSDRLSRGFRPFEYRESGSMLPHAIDSEVDKAYLTGKRRRIAGNELSHLSRHHGPDGEYPPQRTVLVPLDQYGKNYGGNPPYHRLGHGGYVTEPVYGRWIRTQERMTEQSDAGLSRRHDSTGTVAYEVPMHLGVEHPSQRQPHFQIQIPPRGAVAHVQSPINTAPARSEFDQTLRPSYSSPSFFPPVAQRAFLEHDRNANLREGGRRMSELDVPSAVQPSPNRMVDRRSGYAVPNRSEHPRYSDTQTEHDQGRAFQLPARPKESFTGVDSPRPGHLSTTMGEVFRPSTPLAASAHSGATDRYSFPSSTNVGGTMAGARPSQYHGENLRHSSYSIVCRGHSERAPHGHDDGAPSNGPTHLISGRPEAPAIYSHYGVPSPRHNEARREVVVLD